MICIPVWRLIHYSRVLLPLAAVCSCAGAAEFDNQLADIIKGGGSLTSSSLRALLAPAACQGVGTPAGRSLQDEFDGVVACFKALLEEHEQLQEVLGSVNELVLRSAGERAADEVLEGVQQVLQAHANQCAGRREDMREIMGECAAPPAGEEGPSAEDDERRSAGDVQGSSRAVRLARVSDQDVTVLRRKLSTWEARVRTSQTPSRVFKWAAAG